VNRAVVPFSFSRMILCLGASLLFPLNAHAYLDPGSGSLLFQSLLAVIFGIGVAFRSVREFISRAFDRLFKRKRPGDDGE